MPRTRTPSLKSVARKAGVSQASASLILSGRGGDYRLSDETTAKVMAAASSLGYARPERRRGPPRIHVAHLADLLKMDERGLGGALLYPLLDALTALGWQASVDPALPPDPAAAGPAFLTASAVLLPVNLGFDEVIARLSQSAAARGVQPVILGRHGDALGGIQLDGDQAAGGRLAANHLLDLGHCRIALLGGAAGDPHSDARLDGFQAACAKRGVDLPASCRWGDGGYEADGAYRLAAARLAAGARPSAIFCCNDRMAIGVLMALREAGLRVPDDVSLVGFDDQASFSSIAPGLTTVRIDAAGIGSRVASLLAAGGPVRQERITIPARLVARGSTAQAQEPA